MGLASAMGELIPPRPMLFATTVPLTHPLAPPIGVAPSIPVLTTPIAIPPPEPPRPVVVVQPYVPTGAGADGGSSWLPWAIGAAVVAALAAGAWFLIGGESGERST
jgi:hypothetical protein